MNKPRRERISAIINKLGELSEELETIKDEEQDYYDNMPESLQGGEKGEAAQSAIDALENAKSEIEQATTNLENIE